MLSSGPSKKQFPRPTARLPLAKFDAAEPLEQTVRRDLYAQTGALLKRSQQLGILHFEHADPSKRHLDRHVPIYIGVIYELESPILHSPEQRELVSFDEASQRLRQDYLRKVKAFLFSQALNHIYEMKKEKR